MIETRNHTFHIPVLGLGYTIDTPLKVARYGISSVVSIIEDDMVEKMRAYHCGLHDEEYRAITTKDPDYRACRITAYLNLLDKLVNKQISVLKELPFSEGSEIIKYFEKLPNNAPARQAYYKMMAMPDGIEKVALQQALRQSIVPGSIDVNIMAKVDKLNYASDGTTLPAQYSDALSAFRGFANSTLRSSVVLSAGYNPRLYNYIEEFPDFFPNAQGVLNKKIILKVSDYRSALIQGKILAKKGIWVSEFRIESGLNCGGHAFPTDGMLLGPILEEFRLKRRELTAELLEMCNAANQAKGGNTFTTMPVMRITVQGGIGTANEDKFLIEHYGLDGTGWGSPFLLVPEATNVEEKTLHDMATSQKEDYYISFASPLGVPFQNFRKSSAEKQRNDRIEKGRSGSPCYKKFLATDTEFTKLPICTASREYQELKLKQLREKNLPESEYQAQFKSITDKDCLCEGLCSSVYLKDGIPPSHNLKAVTICPGPNLAYFSGIFSLQQMVDHIYGRVNLLNDLLRPNMFINEAELYIDYLKQAVQKSISEMNAKQTKYFNNFRANLMEGIEYYKNLIPDLKRETNHYKELMNEQLQKLQSLLTDISVPELV